MSDDNKQLLAKLTLFLVPVVILSVFPIILAIMGGEFASLSRAAALQIGEQPVLYGPAYRGDDRGYKVVATRQRHPDVLILGSSRVLQFRSLFFHKKPRAFYNAGMAAQSVAEAYSFVRALSPDRMPRVVIIGMDQRWFFEPYLTAKQRRDAGSQESLHIFGRALFVGRLTLQDLWDGKVRLQPILAGLAPVHGVKAIGFRAIMTGNGFRNDGSLRYGSLRPMPPAKENVTKALRDNDGPMMRANPIWEPAIMELKALVMLSAESGWTVIGFSPPFAPSLYDAMRRDGQYLPRLASRLRGVFKEYGCAYFDFSDPGIVGGLDSDMLDWSHPSEYLSLQMYARMVKDLPEILGPFSDEDVLAGLAARAPKDRFEFVGEQ